jgi:HAD superfamily hydrolase (TIGR01490 family)
MPLALFDLDNTLLNGDSDHAWGLHLCAIGAVDAADHRSRHEQYYKDYVAGVLDINEFLEFQLKPLAENSTDVLKQWREDYLTQQIEPMIEHSAIALINQHREQGHDLVVITATNSFITKPIAERLGIPTLIATEPESINGQFTGKVNGTPCFQSGKVEKLTDWISKNKYNLTNSWFYSDSYNDLPLLLEVDNPVVTNPDEKLATVASEKGWPVLHLFSNLPSNLMPHY